MLEAIESRIEIARGAPRPVVPFPIDLDKELFRNHARKLAADLAWIPSIQKSNVLTERASALAFDLHRLFSSASRAKNTFRDYAPAMKSNLYAITETFRSLRTLPHVRTVDGVIIPRILAIVSGFAKISAYHWNEHSFLLYAETFQQTTILNLAELRALNSALILIWLEHLLDALQNSDSKSNQVLCLEDIRTLGQLNWLNFIEPLILFDRYLLQDPAGAYSQMDTESRHSYRMEVAYIAQHSDLSEVEVARAVLELAQNAKREPDADTNKVLRVTHVGYYLISSGASKLWQSAQFRPPIARRAQLFVKEHADDFYIPCIALFTIALASGIAEWAGITHASFWMALIILLTLLLPCSETAVQLANYFFTLFLKPSILPKLEFPHEIPASHATMVAVPALLINPSQVQKLVDDLEVRFLGNADKNLHFALLTDLPDSIEAPKEEDSLAIFCGELIAKLNEKYGHQQRGSFFLFHRKRLYNPREQAWMGWERKRGKLLEFNQYLRGCGTPYKLEIGNLSILPKIHFVISLDADTLLPRGTARRMIGTLAHPLNQAIVDPERNVVTAGYGILQPRVGISVQSVAHSRLAKIYSGETGLDIYSHAVSDVYQDLYGEGSYVGKGIYDVDILHRVLDKRFPNNLLLSHDLIEGAYARAGLVSDIEIIEDYPSHYSAYNRRKHRWLRGDWQIIEWLSSKVSDHRGMRVSNPISLIAQWKILDNLRRSLVEPAIFLLLMMGWIVLPGSPFAWTVAALVLLFLPHLIRATVQICQAILKGNLSQAGIALNTCFAATISVMLTVMFLAHQMLVSLDAMSRALLRRFFTGKRMLEWVTSAEEELALARRTPLDMYLDWTPVLSLAIGVLVLSLRSGALLAALPVLGLWASSKSMSAWLNQPPSVARKPETKKERLLLRRIALRTWRYFEEHSNASNHWLIPDNVRESPAFVDNRLSPTNLGLLLNSRLVAHHLGYLTLPEFVDLTTKTLSTIELLPRFRGHFYNWYSNISLQPLAPFVVSSVDSGNLLASLWTLEQGCIERLREPLIKVEQVEGFVEYLRELVSSKALPKRVIKDFIHAHKQDWMEAIETFPVETLLKKRNILNKNNKGEVSSSWLINQAELRLTNTRSMLRSYAPWLLHEFRMLETCLPGLDWGAWSEIALQDLPDFIDALQLEIALVSELSESTTFTASNQHLCQELAELLPDARGRITALIHELEAIAVQASELARDTDFKFLLHPQRNLLSVSYDVASQKMSDACYDQLASESRIATFVAIAKNDIPQESWFSLGRQHKLHDGHIVLLSWAGTMFEYLMPCLWMNTYQNTLLDRACTEAVCAQRKYAERKHTPWGISESAYADRDPDGSYRYFAFGLPDLALRNDEDQSLVISPYSTLLALHVTPAEALGNLRRMDRWVGALGFYEAADYSDPVTKKRMHRPELIRSWMAHHQGMSLLAIVNFLCDGVARSWFHKNPHVQATELLLQERPVTRRNLPSGPRWLAA